MENILDYVGLGPYTSLVIFILLNMLLAASIQVVMASGVFSVASVAFAALGAYASADMTKHYNLPLGVAMLVAIAVCVVVAPIFLVPAQRLKGMYLALSTIAFVLVFQVIAFGINLFRFRLLVLELSAILGGVNGAFTAHYLAFISPELFGFGAVTSSLAAAIVGGFDSWVGAYIGAAILTLLPQFLLGLTGWADLINGALIVAVMVFQPGGLLVGLKRAGSFVRRRAPAFAR